MLTTYGIMMLLKVMYWDYVKNNIIIIITTSAYKQLGSQKPLYQQYAPYHASHEIPIRERLFFMVISKLC